MYFTKSLSNILVGALLATTALGETLQVPRRAADPASYTLEDRWSQKEIEMYAEEYQACLDTIAQARTLSPEEKKHDYKEVWKLSIKSDKTIECGPEGGDNKCKV